MRHKITLEQHIPRAQLAMLWKIAPTHTFNTLPSVVPQLGATGLLWPGCHRAMTSPVNAEGRNQLARVGVRFAVHCLFTAALTDRKLQLTPLHVSLSPPALGHQCVLRDVGLSDTHWLPQASCIATSCPKRRASSCQHAELEGGSTSQSHVSVFVICQCDERLSGLMELREVSKAPRRSEERAISLSI